MKKIVNFTPGKSIVFCLTHHWGPAPTLYPGFPLWIHQFYRFLATRLVFLTVTKLSSERWQIRNQSRVIVETVDWVQGNTDCPV